MTNPFKISSLFSSKTSFQSICGPLWFINFICVQCTSEYMGPTTHSPYRRVAQHSGSGFRTNRLVTTPPHSNIRDHTFNCHSPITLENFTIMNSCKSETDLHILESLYIYKTNPCFKLLPINDSDTFVSFIIVLPPHPPPILCYFTLMFFTQHISCFLLQHCLQLF